MGGGPAGQSRDGNVDKTKEEKGTSKDGGENKEGIHEVFEVGV